MTPVIGDIAIYTHGLTKIYPGSTASAALRTMALRLMRKRPTGAKALDDIGFTVRSGEALGIVGRNGSGKSTLLKTLAGALRPTLGRVEMRGRVGTLLDLGAGIHPEYTGAENALVLGMLAGLSKAEVRERMDAIREFSGLGEAFDHAAKTYSSGMTLRLGFSAAIHSNPDVLLIDEALAVGDAFFQQRCLARMRRLRQDGTTIVLVSHDPSAILSLCDRAIWLERGRISAEGSPAEVIKRYLAARYRDDCELDAPLASASFETARAEGATQSGQDAIFLRSPRPITQHDERFGDKQAQVIGMEIRGVADEPISTVSPGQSVAVVISLESHQRIENPLVGFTLRNRLGDVVTATNSELEGVRLSALEANSTLDVAFRFIWPTFSSGSFSFSPAIADGSIASHRMCDWVENVWILESENPRGLFGWMSLEEVSLVTQTHKTEPATPIVTMKDPDERTTIAPPRIEFSVETPTATSIERDQLTNSGELFVSGWCFATSGEPVRLTAHVDDLPPRSVVASGFRQDVGRVHSAVPGAGRSGFGLLVPFPIGTTPRLANCRIDAQVGNHSTPVANLELELPAMLEIASPPAIGQRRPRRSSSDRPRILFVSHTLNLEGAPRSLFEIADALDSKRFDRRLCSPTTGPLGEVWAENGIPVGSLQWDWSITSADDFDAQVRRLAGLASVWQPDLIVANTLETYWAMHVAAELGRPSIWIVRESEAPDVYFHSRWPTAIAERAQAALSIANRVVFVAEATRALFANHLHGSRDRLIPTGLDLARFDLSRSGSVNEIIRRELRLARNTPLLLCVGTTCQRKAQLELIRALGILRASRPDFHCVFLGVVEGEYLSAMRSEIEALDLGQNVTLEKPALDALPYFAAADVTICNSWQESLPRAVLEAMGFAKPIVATRVFGIPELVRDEIDALLVEPGDIESLAKAIDRLLSDPALATALGASARRRVENEFSIDRCAAQYSNLFDEVLREPPGADR